MITFSVAHLEAPCARKELLQLRGKARPLEDVLAFQSREEGIRYRLTFHRGARDETDELTADKADVDADAAVEVPARKDSFRQLVHVVERNAHFEHDGVLHDIDVGVLCEAAVVRIARHEEVQIVRGEGDLGGGIGTLIELVEFFLEPLVFPGFTSRTESSTGVSLVKW
jgi:hypothetical protein